jgi:hypothetical protein
MVERNRSGKPAGEESGLRPERWRTTVHTNDLQPLVPATLKGVLDTEVNSSALFDTRAVADALLELGIDRDEYLGMDREEQHELTAPIWEAARRDADDVCDSLADEVVEGLNPGLNPTVTRAALDGDDRFVATVTVGDRTVTIGDNDARDDIMISIGDEDWCAVTDAVRYLNAA